MLRFTIIFLFAVGCASQRSAREARESFRYWQDKVSRGLLSGEGVALLSRGEPAKNRSGLRAGP
jgi:hypothetical protein